MYTTAAGQTMAALQKWVLSDGTWHLAYTLQAGLGLGAPLIPATFDTQPALWSREGSGGPLTA